MKKFINSLRFISKVFLLILLLMVGWAFVNVTNLVKGKKSADKSGDTGNLFGPETAGADTCSNCSTCSTCTTTTACPHVAYFDGKEFKMENDFLPSEFKTLEPGLANLIYKRTVPAPDMLKLSSTPQKYNGALTLRLEEIEPEESFIHWIKLFRVVHSEDEELVIDAVGKTPYVVRKKELEEKLVFPASAILNAGKFLTGFYRHNNERRLWGDIPESREDLFQGGDLIEFAFQNLQKDKEHVLVLRSVYRDWMAGEETKEVNFFSAFIRSSALTKVVVFGWFYLFLKSRLPTESLALLPFVIGSGSMCKSIAFSYRSASGKFTPLMVQKPRSFRHSTEVVSLPREAVGEDGSLIVRADFTKRHRLSFIGVAEEPTMRAAESGELSIKKALHSRLGDVTDTLRGGGKNETHLIPGDTVEVSFENPTRPVSSGQRETYLFQSSGFYTALRPEYKKIAGNWQEKLSPEAKSRLASLVSLKDYA